MRHMVLFTALVAALCLASHAVAGEPDTLTNGQKPLSSKLQPKQDGMSKGQKPLPSNMATAPEASSEGVDDGMIQLGSNLLRAALIFEQGRLRGVTSTEMIAELKELGYASEIQDAFRGISLVAEEGAERIVQIADLNVYMELSQDVRSTTGSMLAAKGQRVTAAMLARFLNFQRADKLRGPVRVVMLSSDDGGKPEVAESSGASSEPQA